MLITNGTKNIIDKKTEKSIKKVFNSSNDWAIKVLNKLLENYWDEKDLGYNYEVVNDEDTMVVAINIPSIHNLDYYSKNGEAFFPIGESYGSGSIQIRCCNGVILNVFGKIRGRRYTETEDMPNDIPGKIITGMIEPYCIEIDEIVSKKDSCYAWEPETTEYKLAC